MKTIWKFEISLLEDTYVELPLGSTFLHGVVQNGIPCVWYRVDTMLPPVKERLYLCGTGCPLPEDAGRYLCTFQLHAGKLVLHLFEEAPKC